MEETRQRIVEAAVELHGTIGPANTTVSAIAERAGVQRSTVYRHFEDEDAIYSACTSHWMARHPWPAFDRWLDIDDPVERLRVGLGDLYRYYADNRQMLSNSQRDLEVMPAFVGDLMATETKATFDALIRGWPDRDHQLAIGHAIDFRTWQSLDDLGAEAGEAAELMAAMVAGIR